MKKIIYTIEFEKNLEKAIKRGYDKADLNELIQRILNGNLRKSDRNHKWKGHYKKHKDVKECHIKPDWILIYEDTKDILYLITNGYHGDFKI